MDIKPDDSPEELLLKFEQIRLDAIRCHPERVDRLIAALPMMDQIRVVSALLSLPSKSRTRIIRKTIIRR